jgi:geranylgeranyl reductase family protein
MIKKYDIIICGAGPAGSTCALALAKSGLRVAMIEKNSFPRDKVCGDAVAAYVPKVLQTIDPLYKELLAQFPHKTYVDTCRIVAPNGTPLDLQFPEYGFISTRLSFDAFLFEQVKACSTIDIFLNTAIEDIHISEELVNVQCAENIRMEAALIIGCDGAQGVTAKKLTPTKMDLKHYSGAVRAYFKNVKDIPTGTFELHFLKHLLPGYLWIFPLPDNTANVGLGMLSDAVSKRKVNLKQELLKALQQEPYLAERFKDAEMMTEIKGYGLPLGSRKVMVSGHRFMLCGDAASLIDPVSGEGIGQAIVSGRYAGWHAMKCFEKGDFSADFMKQYDKCVYDKLWNDHQKRYWVQRLIDGRPRLINAAISLAKSNQWIHKLVEKVVW